MSTNYRALDHLSFHDVFNGQLERFGVREAASQRTTDGSRCLTDGSNFLWVYATPDGVAGFTRYHPNGAPGAILAAIEEAFGIEIVSEHDPRYYGYETQEEWDAALDKMHTEHQEHFYEQLMHYVSGRAHEITEGTVGEAMAKIAKHAVSTDPELLVPENRDKLLSVVEERYEREQSLEASSLRERNGARTLPPTSRCRPTVRPQLRVIRGGLA
jgi:hypothetical protein